MYELGGEEFRILDVGCGEGVLLDYFHRKGFSFLEYVGIDISREAIQIALSRYPSTSFIIADIEEYQHDSLFDMIIFNESLYYTKRPVNVMKKYEKNLKPNGIFIVSMCDYPGHSEIQKRIDARYKCLERCSVTNANNQRWNMAVFKISNE